MNRPPRAVRSVAAVFLFLAVPVMAAGCGEESHSSSVTDKATNSSSASTAGSSRPGPESRAASGLADHTHPGGEGSIEDFGSEARGSRRAALLGAFHAYLNALAAQRYRTACAYLASRVRGSLSQLSAPGSAGRSCPPTLSRLFSPSAAVVAHSQASGKIATVRVRGDLAFVVFHAPGANLYQLSFVKDSGWKASVATPSILVPSRASLEG